MTVSLASFCTLRRDSGVTIGPIRSVLVAQAMTASAIQGSAMAFAGERWRMWSQTKNPSQPCSSAAEASSATTRGSASSPNGAMSMARFTRLSLMASIGC